MEVLKTFKIKLNYSGKYGYRLFIGNKNYRYIVPFEKDINISLLSQMIEVATKKLKSEGYEIIGYTSDMNLIHIICK